MNSSRLPLDIRGREQWEALGVAFGEKVDDLFCEATIPDGWDTRATDHSMWNEIVDSRGRVRGMYFYKGSFWDRSAHLNEPRIRYVARRDYSDDVPDDHVRAIVVDQCTGENVYQTEPEAVGDRKRYDVAKDHVHRAAAWLSIHYPEHSDCLAYWD